MRQSRHLGRRSSACKAEPSLNAWYNAAVGQRRLIKRVDIGIAVDTEDGLIVPILRNVSERGARELRAGLDRMRAGAEARSIPVRGAQRSDDYVVEFRHDWWPLREPCDRPAAGGDHWCRAHW